MASNTPQSSRQPLRPTTNALGTPPNRARTTATATVALLLLAATATFAAPLRHAPFTFTQPDGSRVPVIVDGDEFFQEVRTTDGRLLMRDAQGWIVFALASESGDALLSTGLRYAGAEPAPAAGGAAAGLSGNATQDSTLFATRAAQTPGLAPDAKARLAREQRLKLLGVPGRSRPTWEHPSHAQPSSANNRSSSGTNAISGSQNQPAPAPSATPAPAAAAPDTIWGITILADFPGTTSSVGKTELENLLNQSGYSNYSNNGSVRDYFYEVSNGRFVYVNRVVGFVTVSHAKSWYDRVGGDPQAFMSEVMALAKATGFNFSTLTTNSQKEALGVNVLYAGEPDAGWAEGLWPHQGYLYSNFSANGVSVSAYEMTNIGSRPDIGTLVHENGHLLFGWEDLYAYDNATNGAGNYCVMSTASTTNPMYPNPYYRFLQGWIDTVDITAAAKGSTYSMNTSATFAYVYSGKTKGSAKESFFIEVKARTGRNTGIPDAGLAIWHVDQNGSNTNGGGIGRDYVNVEQADGDNDLELSRNMGDSYDLFDSSTPNFSDATRPTPAGTTTSPRGWTSAMSRLSGPR
jgi:M6 family metalloprotease-like protein